MLSVLYFFTKALAINELEVCIFVLSVTHLILVWADLLWSC